MRRTAASCLAALLALSGCGGGAGNGGSANSGGSANHASSANSGGTGSGEALLVLAAASLQDPLTAAALAFETRGGGAVDFSFAGSNFLQRQIERGARADVFLPASLRLLDALAAAGLLREGPPRLLASNELAVVAPPGWMPPGGVPASLETLVAAGGRIALGEEGVPIGDYARQALQGAGVWDRARRRVVPLADEGAVLAVIERGAVDWGIVYRSSAQRAAAAGRLRRLLDLPRAAHAPIVYGAAVLAASRQPRRAMAFLDFLTSADGQALLLRHGLQPPPDAGARRRGDGP